MSSDAAGSWSERVLTADPQLAALLARVRRIAVVGIKDDPLAIACRIPSWLAERGYEIVPVNPKLASWRGRRALASLEELEAPVDLVNVFRAPPHVPRHAEEALARPPLGFWMQSGIRSPPAAERLARAGVLVVEDRCLMVEIARLA